METEVAIEPRRNADNGIGRKRRSRISNEISFLNEVSLNEIFAEESTRTVLLHKMYFTFYQRRAGGGGRGQARRI